MDVSFLLIVGPGKKMNTSFFTHSLYGGILGDVSLPVKAISVLYDSETVLLHKNKRTGTFANHSCVLELSVLLWLCSRTI